MLKINPWYFATRMMLILLMLIIVFFVSVIMILIPKIRKVKGKKLGILIGINLVFITALVLYWSSHSTYYKYNDWAILGSSIDEIEEKYGAFDLGFGEMVGYYIYTDHGPFMPDNLDHYYYMKYDENGIVYEVFDGCQPGG